MPDQLDMDFNLDDLNALMEAPAKQPSKTPEKPQSAAAVYGPEAPDPGESSREVTAPTLPSKPPRALSELGKIVGGVFLVVGLISWLLMTFVFVEKDEEESAIELPRDRMESVTMELAVGSLRHEGSIEKRTGKGPQTVFILELDASIIVQGTASELMEVESKLKKHHYRIEEAIDETIRTSTPALLTEPDTLTIRNQIRDRINQIIEMSVVKEVVFGHYRAFHTPIKT
jgi:flagellar basal body-associated protein FliL